jgi:uncharacterized protein (TIGR02145 family)
MGQSFLTDERDGTTYEIVQIGDKLWFQDNLRFITPTSWCGEKPNSQACNNGNYYYPTDIINVCPTDWRVPTWKEYKEAIKIIEGHYNLEVDFNSGEVPLYRDLNLDAEQIQGLTLMNDTAFFNMAATGWIEGDKWEPQNQTTMWVIHDISNTPQPHVHITPEQVIMHSHGHNILDKPNKLRRFSIRCIKPVTE